jgi:hypothetical protein
MENKESIAKPPSGRVTRTPVGQRNLLTVKGKDPSYNYRIVNDVDGRIAQFMEAGYEVVPRGTVEVGDKRASAGTPVGTISNFSVGGGQKAVLMRQKKEWFEEDQKRKQDFVDAQEASIKQKALDGNYGKLEIKRE